MAQVVFVRKRLVEIRTSGLSSATSNAKNSAISSRTRSKDRSRRVPASQWHPLPQNPCTSCAYIGLCLGRPDLAEAALVRRPGAEDFGLLTSLRNRIPPMLPKLNRKRALFVLTKIDEILAWERRSEAERDTRFVELGRYLCECERGVLATGETKSFDEFLTRRFPESRRRLTTSCRP